MHDLLLSTMLAFVSSAAHEVPGRGGPDGREPLWRVGQPAPHLHLPDVATGAPVDLAGFRGKKVLLAEFASW